MTTTTSVPAINLLRSPNFGALWLAQVASRFGDPITLIALAYASYIRTHSALVTALAVVMATIPNALFGIFGGVIADAAGHRRAMIACDLARVVLVGSVPITLALGLPLVFPTSWCSRRPRAGRSSTLLVSRFFRASSVPKTFPARTPSRTPATARSRCLGRLAAGLLVGLSERRAFYVDALTFLVSAALLANSSG